MSETHSQKGDDDNNNGMPASYIHKSSPYLYLRAQNACWGSFVAGYTISELGITFNYLATNFGTPDDERRDLCVI